MSTIDVLILLPLIPLGLVVVTWWLPWERFFGLVPLNLRVLGPYLLYAAFAAWHFKLAPWQIFLVGATGTGCCVAALVDRTFFDEASAKIKNNK